MVERLHAEFHRRLTIEELAPAAEVHPVRLARMFRRRIGVGIGEYVLGLRVRRVEERSRRP